MFKLTLNTIIIIAVFWVLMAVITQSWIVLIGAAYASLVAFNLYQKERKAKGAKGRGKHDH